MVNLKVKLTQFWRVLNFILLQITSRLWPFCYILNFLWLVEFILVWQCDKVLDTLSMNILLRYFCIHTKLDTWLEHLSSFINFFLTCDESFGWKFSALNRIRSWLRYLSFWLYYQVWCAWSCVYLFSGWFHLLGLQVLFNIALSNDWWQLFLWFLFKGILIHFEFVIFQRIRSFKIICLCIRHLLWLWFLLMRVNSLFVFIIIQKWRLFNYSFAPRMR